MTDVSDIQQANPWNTPSTLKKRIVPVGFSYKYKIPLKLNFNLFICQL